MAVSPRYQEIRGAGLLFLVRQTTVSSVESVRLSCLSPASANLTVYKMKIKLCAL